MATTARMGFAFSRVGLTGADAGVTYFLPRLVGPARAMEILLMGRVFDGEAAARDEELKAKHKKVSWLPD